MSLQSDSESEILSGNESEYSEASVCNYDESVEPLATEEEARV